MGVLEWRREGLGLADVPDIYFTVYTDRMHSDGVIFVYYQQPPKLHRVRNRQLFIYF